MRSARAAARSQMMRKPASTDVVEVLHQSTIEAGINVLDSLEEGDEDTARLLVASSVNSHIVMWEKMASGDNKKSNISETWRRQMSEHNSKSGLSLPAKTP